MNQISKIRPAAIDDLDIVRKLLSDCNLPVEGLDAQFAESFCVAENNGKIVGLAGIEVYGCYGLLRSVAVSPARQGKSIAKALVEERLCWANRSGLTDVYLLTIDAGQYFERFGFYYIDRDKAPSEIRKSSEFSTICPESAILMVRSLCNSE